ncbi:hypothetical protein QJS66_09625 [Kocuria rhizophila]|nr:hypothetical protein QJS66_09625 [Kocuria rhizophila]
MEPPPHAIWLLCAPPHGRARDHPLPVPRHRCRGCPSRGRRPAARGPPRRRRGAGRGVRAAGQVPRGRGHAPHLYDDAAPAGRRWSPPAVHAQGAAQPSARRAGCTAYRRQQVRRRRGGPQRRGAGRLRAPGRPRDGSGSCHHPGGPQATRWRRIGAGSTRCRPTPWTRFPDRGPHVTGTCGVQLDAGMPLIKRAPGAIRSAATPPTPPRSRRCRPST